MARAGVLGWGQTGIPVVLGKGLNVLLLGVVEGKFVSDGMGWELLVCGLLEILRSQWWWPWGARRGKRGMVRCGEWGERGREGKSKFVPFILLLL